MITNTFEGVAGQRQEVCIVGAGPVGISLALELEKMGISTLVLEAGGWTREAGVQSLSKADILPSAAHDDMLLSVARQLGGTSALWGGRCVPLDRVDFLDRPNIVPSVWPIKYEELAPFYARACEYADAGKAVFEFAEPIETADDSFSRRTLERWSNRPRFQRRFRRLLNSSRLIDIRLYAVTTDLIYGPFGRVEAVIASRPDSSCQVRIPVRQVVIAAGGVETTRLLLWSKRNAPDMFGGQDGALGRYHMAHVSGAISEITFTPSADKAFDFHVDKYGSYVRRRIVPSMATQIDQGIMNSAFWPVVPAIHNPDHGSGVLSSLYLLLSVAPVGRALVAEVIRRRHVGDHGHWAPHLANVARDLPQTLKHLSDFLRNVYLNRSRAPGFFVRNPARRYVLMYHSEQWPNAASRITLSNIRDKVGMPRASISFHFHENDANSVVRTHELLESWFRTTGLGRLKQLYEPEDRAVAVLAQARHGAHQIGTTRMAASPKIGVVDGHLQTFDSRNLHIVGSSVMPTSGQANPTLTSIALAVRLSSRLAHIVKSSF